jgi:spermidine/putrescine-binding protein
MTLRLNRRALLGTTLALPAIWGRDAVAQIRRGDELTVGIWGGVQERTVREFCATPLERQYGVKINFILGGTPERRARAYAETRNPNIVIADPAEGQAVAMNVACITTGTRNQALAEAFVNLHLSPECMTAYAERTYYSPTVKNVSFPPELAAKLILGEEAVKKLVDFDWDVVIGNQARWSSRFTREIAG